MYPSHTSIGGSRDMHDSTPKSTINPNFRNFSNGEFTTLQNVTISRQTEENRIASNCKGADNIKITQRATERLSGYESSDSEESIDLSADEKESLPQASNKSKKIKPPKFNITFGGGGVIPSKNINPPEFNITFGEAGVNPSKHNTESENKTPSKFNVNFGPSFGGKIYLADNATINIIQE